MVENFEIKTEKKRKTPERLEVYFEALDNLLKQISREINKEAREYREDEQGLVDEDCRIKMEAFIGVHSEDKIKRDNQYIEDQNKRFAPNSQLESVQTYYKTDAPDEILQKWQENKKKSDGSLMEMAVNSVFYKILKDKFLVVRASTYDDYHNGVDNILVDKESGQVICAFDEIRVGPFESDKKNLEKKFAKIKSKLEKGGTKLDYGLTFVKDEETDKIKLEKRAIENLPIFWLALSKEDLGQLLLNMNYDLEVEPNEVEKEIFDKLIFLIEKQKDILTTTRVKDELKENLEGVDDVLTKIKSIRKKLK